MEETADYHQPGLLVQPIFLEQLKTFEDLAELSAGKIIWCFTLEEYLEVLVQSAKVRSTDPMKEPQKVLLAGELRRMLVQLTPDQMLKYIQGMLPTLTSERKLN